MLGISKETVHALPEVHYPGKVILIDSAAKARDAVAYLLKQPQIGFDTETRPSFQKNHRYKVSLVQLSVPGECFLFRLKQIGSLDGLMSIFENPAIQKIGLSLKDDFHSLAKLCEFTPAGFVELQTFVKEYEIADNSLQKIFALIFGQRISKNQRLTNWEAAELTPGQQSYAAIDAWACVEIYNHLMAGRFHPEECPYKIDDETAKMLQNSVGIHLPLKNADGEHASDEISPAIAESTALNGKPVKRKRGGEPRAAKPSVRKPRKSKASDDAAKEKPAKPKATKKTAKKADTVKPKEAKVTKAAKVKSKAVKETAEPKVKATKPKKTKAVAEKKDETKPKKAAAKKTASKKAVAKKADAKTVKPSTAPKKKPSTAPKKKTVTRKTAKQPEV